jgi:hypothetical protein
MRTRHIFCWLEHNMQESLNATQGVLLDHLQVHLVAHQVPKTLCRAYGNTDLLLQTRGDKFCCVSEVDFELQN